MWSSGIQPRPWLAPVVAVLLLLTRAAESRAAPPPADPAVPKRMEQLASQVAKVVTERGEGSGFLVRADGALVTAFHVVNGAGEIWAHFPGGHVCRVEGVLLTRPDLDLVVLKLPAAQLPPGLPPFPLNASGALSSGTSVYALGYPEGRGPHVIPGSLLTHAAAGAERPRMLQLLAGIKHGCSGGPLVDSTGAVLGVISSGLFHDDLAFAADLARLGPLPEPERPVLSMEEAARRYEGSAAEFYARGLSVLEFWREHKGEAAGNRAAKEWPLVQFNEARKRDPEMAEAHFHAGLCLFSLGRLPDAVSAMQRVLKLVPDNVAANFLLSGIYSKMGRKSDAVQAIREVLRTCPNFGSGRRLLAAFYVEDKRYAAAAAELRHAARLQPDNVNTQAELGRVLLELRRYEEALAAYQRLIQLKPGSWEGHDALGRSYAALRQYPAAVTEYRTAIRLQPDYAAAHYDLALAALAQGDRATARKEQVTLENQSSSLARDLNRQLRQPQRGK